MGLFVTNEANFQWTEQVKNPNWQEANKLVMYKCSLGVEPETTKNKSGQGSEKNLNSGSLDFMSDALTTLPLLVLTIIYRFYH